MPTWSKNQHLDEVTNLSEELELYRSEEEYEDNLTYEENISIYDFLADTDALTDLLTWLNEYTVNGDNLEVTSQNTEVFLRNMRTGDTFKVT